MKSKLLPFFVVLVAASALVSLAQANPPEPAPYQITNAVPIGTTNVPPPAAPVPEPPSLPASGNVTMPGVNPVAPTNAPVIIIPQGEELAGAVIDVGFDDLALPDAIRQLAVLAGLNIQFDHRLDTWIDPLTHTPVPFPTVKEKWKNLTALQALQALLDKYGWEMRRYPTTPVVMICAKEAGAPEHQSMEVILLGYSEPTNIVAEVQKALGATIAIIPDLRTHQVIVRAADSVMPQVKNLIHQLDSATGQILIEAKIIETTKDVNTAKGVDWSGTLQAQHVSFGNGLTAGTTTANAQSGNNLLGGPPPPRRADGLRPEARFPPSSTILRIMSPPPLASPPSPAVCLSTPPAASARTPPSSMPTALPRSSPSSIPTPTPNPSPSRAPSRWTARRLH